VGQVVRPTYRAFIVHAKADDALARALQRGLEDVLVPWALIGRDTPQGPVPKTLRPLFRLLAPAPAVMPERTVPERTAPAADASAVAGEPPAAPIPAAGESPAAAETPAPAASPTESSTDSPAPETVAAAPPDAPILLAPAAPVLSDEAVAALVEARHLIVLCSPDAATSEVVDEAVRRFKSLGRGDRVVAVLAGGDPEASERTLCPPALARRLRPDGSVGDEPEEPVAPVVIDARSGRTPPSEVVMRIAATLLGLGVDEFRGPAERAVRNRRRLRGWLGAAAAILLVVGGGVAVVRFALPAHPPLFDAVLGGATEATLASLTAAERLGLPPAAAIAIAEPAAAMLHDLAMAGGDDPRLRLRRAAILLAFAQHRETLGLADGGRARVAAVETLLDPLSGERLDDLELVRELVGLRLAVATTRLAHGETDRALASARAALAGAERLAALDPSSPDRQRDLSRAATAMGDVLVARAALDDALRHYRAALAIRDKLAALDPASAPARRDLSVAHERIGDVAAARGALDDALKSYRAGLSLRLAAVDPAAGAGWQRSLSILYNKIGDAQMAQGAVEDALGSYRAGLALQLAVVDRADAQARRDLSVSYERIGDVLKAQRAYDDALAAYRASLAIRERLAAGDLQLRRWPRDLPVSQERIGDVLMAKGAAEEALAAYRTSLAARVRIATEAPSPAAQRDVAVAQSKIGDALAAKGQGAEALASYRAALAVSQQLALLDPANVQWQWELAVLHWRLASAGDEPAERYRAVVVTLRDLAARRKLSPEQSRWLPLAERELAKARGR
jgi:tetratricopeptide (TPR) repeat protein